MHVHDDPQGKTLVMTVGVGSAETLPIPLSLKKSDPANCQQQDSFSKSHVNILIGVLVKQSA